LDALHIPSSPGAWPALWTVAHPWPELSGKEWPVGGEIDILEGTNGYSTNQFTFHTAPSCTLPTKGWSVASQDCNNGYLPKLIVTYPATVGCVTHSKRKNSFGKSFNEAPGGVFAMDWDVQGGVKIWQFERSQVPADIEIGAPTPSRWGKPEVYLPFGPHCSSDHF
jgi:hypothetical protein